MTTAGNVGGPRLMSATRTVPSSFSLANKTNECWWIADNTASMLASGGNPLASTPWVATAAFPATSPGLETVAGVPTGQGIFYGVFKVTGAATCSTGSMATTLSNVSTTAFPPAQ